MADTKFTRDQYIRELKKLMDANPDIVKAIREEFPDRFYAAIQDHFETYPELGKAKWRSRKGRNKITGSLPTKAEPGEYFRISKVGDGFTFKAQSSRAEHRKKYVSKRAKQIEANRREYLGAVREKAGQQFDELVGSNNTFDMGGKTYNRKEYIDYEVDLAAKQNKLTDVELKKPQEFYPGKSTIGHSTSVYSPEAVEAPHAKYPESKIQNQADQGAEYAGKTERIKQAGMATDVDTAANMQLGTGERVNDPTSGEVRNRIMRGEPEDLVKQQDLLRKKEFINPKYQQAVDIAEQYNISKVVDKAAKATKPLRKVLRYVPIVGGGMVLLNAKAQAEEAIQNPTWQNKVQAGIAGADAALEGVELATGGIGGLITTPLQIGLMIADQMVHQTEDSFTRNTQDWDARRASRRGQS